MNAVLLLLACLVEPPQRPLAPQTGEILISLLGDGWNAPHARVKTIGLASVRRAAGRDVDMPLVHYACALLFIHHDLWEPATDAIERARKSNTDNEWAMLASAYVQLRQKKWEDSLATLTQAAKAHPESHRPLESIAIQVTFLREKPTESLSFEKLSKLENAYFAGLNDADQARYRKVRQQTFDYLADLPAVRESLLQNVAPIRDQMAKANSELAKANAQKTERQERLDALAAQAAAAQQTMANSTNSYDRLIEDARATGNASMVATLQSRRANEVARSRTNIAAIEADMKKIRETIANLEKATMDLTATLQSLDEQLRGEEAKVDEKLALPPLPFDAVAERDRWLRAAHDAALENAKPVAADPPPAAEKNDDEKKARSLLVIADSLLKAGKNDKAREHYERIQREFPNTTAADDVRRRNEASINP